MWLEHLVELVRRETQPSPLPERQEAFVRGFSFYNDIRPFHHLANYRFLGLSGYFGLAAILPMAIICCLLAWLGRPVSDVAPLFKWFSYAFLALFPFLLLYSYWRGYRMRKLRWKTWEWPDFATFAMEEANAQLWGTLNFASVLIFTIAFLGWVVR